MLTSVSHSHGHDIVAQDPWLAEMKMPWPDVLDNSACLNRIVFSDIALPSLCYCSQIVYLSFVPGIIGHTGFNTLLRYLTPLTVSTLKNPRMRYAERARSHVDAQTRVRKGSQSRVRAVYGLPCRYPWPFS